MLPFFFLACNLHNFHDFKLFWNKQELNLIIPNNGVIEINLCEINWVLVGARHMWFYDWLIDWVIWLLYIIDLLCSMICTQSSYVCSLTFCGPAFFTCVPTQSTRLAFYLWKNNFSKSRSRHLFYFYFKGKIKQEIKP